MAYRVVFSEGAQTDVDDLFEWIADHADVTTAQRYIRRIETYCAGFTTFSERGTLRPDLRPGLRIIGFERRVTIAFTIKGEDVVILRVLYAGRSVELAFSDDD